jgi:hypothetical protein
VHTVETWRLRRSHTRSPPNQRGVPGTRVISLSLSACMPAGPVLHAILTNKTQTSSPAATSLLQQSSSTAAAHLCCCHASLQCLLPRTKCILLSPTTTTTYPPHPLTPPHEFNPHLMLAAATHTAADTPNHRTPSRPAPVLLPRTPPVPAATH